LQQLTTLDVLDDFDEIKIAIKYKLDGEEIDYLPASADAIARLEPVYETLPGWKKPTTGAQSYFDLPAKAREYIEYIEKFVGVKVKYIGTGPAREHMIARP
jgi:adenylosuccinate synthase